MYKDTKEVIADIRTIGDNITIRLISKLVLALIDNLRVDNDSALTEDVVRNQGGIRELSRLIETIKRKE